MLGPHSGRPANHRIETLNERNRAIHRRQGRRKSPSISTVPRHSEERFNQTASGTEIKVIARDADSRKLKEHLSGPSECTNEGDEGIALYKPSGRKDSQMWPAANVKRNDEEQPEQDWHDEVKSTDAHVKFKEMFMEVVTLSKFGTGSWAKLKSQTFESS